jgi:hypothetical protein
MTLNTSSGILQYDVIKAPDRDFLINIKKTDIWMTLNTGAETF